MIPLLSKATVLKKLWIKKKFCRKTAPFAFTEIRSIYDELVADLVEEQTDVDRYEDVRKLKPCHPKRNGIFLRIFCRRVSAVMRAEMRVRSATVPHALWTNHGPSGWAKARIPQTSGRFIF